MTVYIDLPHQPVFCWRLPFLGLSASSDEPARFFEAFGFGTLVGIALPTYSLTPHFCKAAYMWTQWDFQAQAKQVHRAIDPSRYQTKQ